MLGDDIPPDKINNLARAATLDGCLLWQGIPDPGGLGGGAERCKTAFSRRWKSRHTRLRWPVVLRRKHVPAEYRGDLFVALHGSWNRSVPTDTSHSRADDDKVNRKAGDFISGWLKPAKRKRAPHGRPVGIAFAPDGSMYISDDEGGVIYRCLEK